MCPAPRGMEKRGGATGGNADIDELSSNGRRQSQKGGAVA